MLFKLTPEIRKFVRHRGSEAEGFTGDGMDEAEFGGVEGETRGGDLRRFRSPLTPALSPGEREFGAIDFFAADGVDLFGEVDADLVGATGF